MSKLKDTNCCLCVYGSETSLRYNFIWSNIVLIRTQKGHKRPKTRLPRRSIYKTMKPYTTFSTGIAPMTKFQQDMPLQPVPWTDGQLHRQLEGRPSWAPWDPQWLPIRVTQCKVKTPYLPQNLTFTYLFLSHCHYRTIPNHENASVATIWGSYRAVTWPPAASGCPDIYPYYPSNAAPDFGLRLYISITLHIFYHLACFYNDDTLSVFFIFVTT